MKRLLPYAQLVRLPNTFTAMADIFLGALATGFLSSRGTWIVGTLFRNDSDLGSFLQEAVAWFSLLFLLSASILLFWSGMVWNDYFDVLQDRRERPSRPLACGSISMKAAWLLACVLMVAGLVMAALAGIRIESEEWVYRWRPLVIACFLIVSILLYDGLLKATFAGPVLMGLCRFLNILLGLSVLGPGMPWGWLLALVIGVYIAGVTWFARTEAHVSSKPMLIGAASVMLAALVLALTVPALAIETTNDREPSSLFPFLLAGFGIYLGIAVLAAIRRPDPMRVQPVIKRAIMGLVVLDALLASAFVGSFGLLLAVLLIPGIILGRWMYST